jgi:hypothetical protein
MVWVKEVLLATLRARVKDEAGNFKQVTVALVKRRPVAQVTSWEDYVADQSTTERVHAMAMISVAGGIAIRALTRLTDVGDDGDFRNFENICKQTGFCNGCLAIWQAAEDRAKQDLQLIPTQRAIRDVAEQLQPYFFGAP